MLVEAGLFLLVSFWDLRGGSPNMSKLSRA